MASLTPSSKVLVTKSRSTLARGSAGGGHAGVDLGVDRPTIACAAGAIKFGDPYGRDDVADNLKVDVDGLLGGGSAIGEQVTALSTSHLESMVGLSDAEPGWVGTSADALVRMASAWQRTADQHHSVLTAQAAHVVAAARSFRAMDEGGAAELEQVGDLADGVS
ncbi:hypothetical protein [Mycobacterium sp. ENV421]|uniref:hypothetical protein n=1 Tax=Mycobacterium sp. ENV421 TaxID=1213407 RepID=UPI0011572D05|nr:hypothetical protein [Mycobacterium sp. ENV421]